MAKYFSKFPKTNYPSLFEDGTADLVTNIISRYALGQGIRDNLSFYINYDIRDGDTPEIIAYKIYNSAERHWLVLIANDIIDVEEQWPLTHDQLNIYINEKYFDRGDGSELGGMRWAANNMYAYYKTETVVAPGNKTTIKKFEIDANTYANANLVFASTDTLTLSDGNVITIKTDKETKTYFEYEYEENESKRKIRLLNFQYLDLIEEELKTIFDETYNNLV